MTKINFFRATGLKRLLMPVFLAVFTVTMIYPFAAKSQETIALQHFQYYKVRVGTGSLAGKSTLIIAAFTQKGFIKVVVDEQNSSLQITAPKGKMIEDVKNVLASFNIGIIQYLEEYTNSPPTIFKN
ncbi:MAG: hypothetical protein IPP51_03265 [Bacteroidetes bacterium]|nr:hypothetical protein [Bacteroidota bacterium]